MDIPFLSCDCAKRIWSGLALALACGLAGCQAEYGADIVNRTPQPVYTSIFRKGPSEAVLGDRRRLGPGDRATIGPVRTSKDYGACLSVDTMGNPGRPVTSDLPRGVSYLEIIQDGEGPNSPLRIVEKK